MPVRLGRFEMPKRLTKEDSTATEIYARFVAELVENRRSNARIHHHRRRRRRRDRNRFEPEENLVQGPFPRAATTAPFGEQGGRSDRGRYPGEPKRRAGESQTAHLHAGQEEEVRDGTGGQDRPRLPAGR